MLGQGKYGYGNTAILANQRTKLKEKLGMTKSSPAKDQNCYLFHLGFARIDKDLDKPLDTQAHNTQNTVFDNLKASVYTITNQAQEMAQSKINNA